MSRNFTKNTANYMTTGVNSFGSLLAGLGVFSFHAIVKLTSKNSSGTQGDDLFYIMRSNTQVGLSVTMTGSAVVNQVRIFARSQAADSGQTVDSTTTLSTGTEYSLGGVVNVASDSMRIYVNGSQEASSSVSFGATTWTSDTPTTASDAIGCSLNSSNVPTSTARQTNGLISELAFWNIDIATAGFAQLANRTSAQLVFPSALLIYFPLVGYQSPERDYVGGMSGTITGTVAADIHPRVIRPTQGLRKVTASTPAFKPAWASQRTRILSGGVT